MKEMCRIVPLSACPTCGHKQFVVVESATDCYLTNRDGDIIDHRGLSHAAMGKCCNCGSIYDMISLNERFIPVTKLRKILFEYNDDSSLLKAAIRSTNPMQIQKNT